MRLQFAPAARPAIMRSMVSSFRGLALLAFLALFLAQAPLAPRVHADSAAPGAGMCRVVNLEFTPGGFAAGSMIRFPGDPDHPYTVPEINPQIVAWVEK